MAPPLKRRRNKAMTVAEKPKARSQDLSFNKRISTLGTKAKELSILCSIPLCWVCFGPDSKLHTWPENESTIRDTITSLKQNRNRRKQVDLLGILESKKNKFERKKSCKAANEFENLLESWGKRVENLCENELVNFDNYLGKKLQVFIDKIRSIKEEKEKKKEKAMMVYDDRISSQYSLNTHLSFDHNDINNIVNSGRRLSERNLTNTNAYLPNKLCWWPEVEEQKEKAMTVYDDRISGQYSLNTRPSFDHNDINNIVNSGRKLSERTLTNTDAYLPSKLSWWPREEKKKPMLLYGDKMSEQGSSNGQYMLNLADTIDHSGYEQSCNASALPAFGTKNCSYTNDAISSNWAMDGYIHAESSNTNGIPNLSRVADCKTGFKIPRNFNLMGYNNKISASVVDINSSSLSNQDFPSQFVQTNNVSIGAAQNYDRRRCYLDSNNHVGNGFLQGLANMDMVSSTGFGISHTLLSCNDSNNLMDKIDNVLPNNCFQQGLVNANMVSDIGFGIPQNFDSNISSQFGPTNMGFNTNFESAQNFGLMEYNDNRILMGQINNNVLPNDDGSLWELFSLTNKATNTDFGC